MITYNTLQRINELNIIKLYFDFTDSQQIFTHILMISSIRSNRRLNVSFRTFAFSINI